MACSSGGSWGPAFRAALIVTIVFVLLALAAAVYDVTAARRATAGERVPVGAGRSG